MKRNEKVAEKRLSKTNIKCSFIECSFNEIKIGERLMVITANYCQSKREILAFYNMRLILLKNRMKERS